MSKSLYYRRQYNGFRFLFWSNSQNERKSILFRWEQFVYLNEIMHSDSLRRKTWQTICRSIVKIDVKRTEAWSMKKPKGENRLISTLISLYYDLIASTVYDYPWLLIWNEIKKITISLKLFDYPSKFPIINNITRQPRPPNERENFKLSAMIQQWHLCRDEKSTLHLWSLSLSEISCPRTRAGCVVEQVYMMSVLIIWCF